VVGVERQEHVGSGCGDLLRDQRIARTAAARTSRRQTRQQFPVRRPADRDDLRRFDEIRLEERPRVGWSDAVRRGQTGQDGVGFNQAKALRDRSPRGTGITSPP
jgi:hypothetical protein